MEPYFSDSSSSLTYFFYHFLASDSHLLLLSLWLFNFLHIFFTIFDAVAMSFPTPLIMCSPQPCSDSPSLDCFLQSLILWILRTNQNKLIKESTIKEQTYQIVPIFIDWLRSGEFEREDRWYAERLRLGSKSKQNQREIEVYGVGRRWWWRAVVVVTSDGFKRRRWRASPERIRLQRTRGYERWSDEIAEDCEKIDNLVWDLQEELQRSWLVRNKKNKEIMKEKNNNR